MRASRIGRTSSRLRVAFWPACPRRRWRRPRHRAGQMPRRDGTGGGGAHIGQIAVVEQKRPRTRPVLARTGPSGRWCSADRVFGLSKKPGLILMAKPSSPAHRPSSRRPRRCSGMSSRRIGGIDDRPWSTSARKASSTQAIALQIERNDAAQFRLGEYLHLRHAASSANGSALPLMTRWCRPISTLRPDRMTATGPSSLPSRPESSAAIPTAPAPSTTSRSSA
jgi:hypothetical protein